MITNGKIQYSIKTGGGTSSGGDSVPVSFGWSLPIDCSFQTNTRDNKGIYVGGKFTVASYMILIEGCEEFNSSRVRLINSRGSIIGEYDVQDMQFLDTVDRIKIQV